MIPKHIPIKDHPKRIGDTVSITTSEKMEFILYPLLDNPKVSLFTVNPDTLFRIINVRDYSNISRRFISYDVIYTKAGKDYVTNIPLWKIMDLQKLEDDYAREHRIDYSKYKPKSKVEDDDE